MGVLFLVLGFAFLPASVWGAQKVVEYKDNKNREKFDDLFKKYAVKCGLDWRFLKCIAMNESTIGENSKVLKGLINPKDIEGSKSDDGKSWGIMQMTLATARDYDAEVTQIKLNSAEYSIGLSSQFIASLKRQFNNKWRDMAMAYNHGAGNQKRFIELEKNGQLKLENFIAGRNYWNKFKNNFKLLFNEELS